MFFSVKVVYLLIFLLISVSCNDDCGLKIKSCKGNTRYRSIDGTCNNLKNGHWGTPFSIYDRLLPAKYGDGENSLAIAISGNSLPNARNLTLLLHGEKPVVDPVYTLNVMQYGELIAHDMSSNALAGFAVSCCTKELKFWPKSEEPKRCATIEIPKDDFYYSFINATCMSLLRTLTNREKSCLMSLNHTEQLSDVNSYIDLSVIYGNTYTINKRLRSFKNGTLLVEVRNNNEWLPTSQTRKECIVLLGPKDRCYSVGDERATQNPQLVLLHILWVREHNRIARELAKLNPHWNDEKLFQVARSINIAEHQYITYYEMLPCYLGRKNLLDKNIIYNTDGYIDDYDENLRPNVYTEHAHGAYKHFHTLIAGQLNLVNGKGCPYSSFVLRDHMNRPHVLEEDDDNFDDLARGLTTQPQMASDLHFDPEITRFGFMRGMRFGHDIRAEDIQRGRDHGVASYNDARELCGLPKAKDFKQFLDVMEKDNLEKLSKVYEHPDDVDLLIGGAFERNVEGTLAGPTFVCIMLKQFERSRKSDRFWFEHTSGGFTLDQLKEIRKSSLAKLFCDNGNNINTMQRQSFLQVSESNPTISCSMIERPDLSKWKEKLD